MTEISSASLLPEFGGTLQHGSHLLTVRVYYEDTDAEGIVYYANYLRFLERGRTEFLRAANLTCSKILEQQGCCYIVRRVELDYRRYAKLDDLLVIKTWIGSVHHASMLMRQDVLRDGIILVHANIQVACIDFKKGGKPVRLPADLKAFFMASQPEILP